MSLSQQIFSKLKVAAMNSSLLKHNLNFFDPHKIKRLLKVFFFLPAGYRGMQPPPPGLGRNIHNGSQG